MTIHSLDDPNMPQGVRDFLARMTRPRDNTVLPPLQVPPPLPESSMRLYTMKVVLLGIEPPIWRRFVAPSWMTLEHIHVLLQIVMGWRLAHSYAYTIQGKRFTPRNKGFAVDAMWDREPSYCADDYQLSQLIESGMTIHYVYDLGDGWTHEIVVESDTPRQGQKDCFYCVEGERACPPEDCGGPHGYADLMDILSNPGDPDHGSRREWLQSIGYAGGRFDSEKFNPDVCNRILQVRSRPSHAKKKADKVVGKPAKKKAGTGKGGSKKRTKT